MTKTPEEMNNIFEQTKVDYILEFNKTTKNFEYYFQGTVPLNELHLKIKKSNRKFDRYENGFTVFIPTNAEQFSLNEFAIELIKTEKND
jgi:hypothetical protein